MRIETGLSYLLGNPVFFMFSSFILYRLNLY